MMLARGRGRPCKQLQEPSCDGCLGNGRLLNNGDIISSSQTKQEYHQCEKEWVRNYNARKHQQEQPTSATGAPADMPTVKEKEDKMEKSKAQSRLQYVNTIKNEICPQLLK